MHSFDSTFINRKLLYVMYFQQAENYKIDSETLFKATTHLGSNCTYHALINIKAKFSFPNGGFRWWLFNIECSTVIVQPLKDTLDN